MVRNQAKRGPRSHQLFEFKGSSQCKVSSVTLMRRLSSNSRKNQIYKAFREVGRVMDRGAAAVPRRLGAAGTGDRGHQQGRGLQRVLRLDPGSATRA